jgi:hypothetical protein
VDEEKGCESKPGKGAKTTKGRSPKLWETQGDSKGDEAMQQGMFRWKKEPQWLFRHPSSPQGEGNRLLLESKPPALSKQWWAGGKEAERGVKL